jgi:methyl-CpG-binding domain protein 4
MDLDRSPSLAAWKLIIATCLLNVTTGRAALPVFWILISIWRTPEDLAKANIIQLQELLKPLGLWRSRAERLIDLSKMWVEDPPREDFKTKSKNQPKYDHTMISRYPGVGKYALDSFRIFLEDGGSGWPFKKIGEKGESEKPWRRALPEDKELRRYLKWRWSLEGLDWEPGEGVIGYREQDAPPILTLLEEARLDSQQAKAAD